MPNWTDAQLDAIKARRGTVLVSAAAGSGKTAVLVERVIERLTDPEHPTDADRLLVVTFTKAAAAEMRDRIEKRLLALMKEQPENTRLRRQQLLLQQAHICTVDSFCSDIVREFFYLLGISPDFSIITDKQQEELMSESLDEVLTGTKTKTLGQTWRMCSAATKTTPAFPPQSSKCTNTRAAIRFRTNGCGTFKKP